MHENTKYHTVTMQGDSSVVWEHLRKEKSFKPPE